jgi:hypothetical protein
MRKFGSNFQIRSPQRSHLGSVSEESFQTGRGHDEYQLGVIGARFESMLTPSWNHQELSRTRLYLLAGAPQFVATRDDVEAFLSVAMDMHRRTGPTRYTGFEQLVRTNSKSLICEDCS